MVIRRRSVRYWLAVLLLIWLVGATASATQAANHVIPDEVRFTEIVRLPVGEGQNSVGYAGSDGGGMMGPESFDVTDDGAIYLLDSVKHRVLAIKNGDVHEVIQFEPNVGLRDIRATSDGTLWMWDTGGFLLGVSAGNGRLLARIPLPEGLKPVSGISLDGTERPMVIIQDRHAARVTAAGVGQPHSKLLERTSIPYETQSLDGRRVTLKVEAGSTIALSYADGVGAVSVLGTDYSGTLYIKVIDLVDRGVGGETTVRAFDSAGILVGVARLPYEAHANMPTRPVLVTRSGDVYYLQPTADHVSIYKVTLGKRYVSQFARIKAAAKAGFVADGTDASRRRAQVTLGGPIAPLEAISVTRDTIMNNTVQMNNYRWYYSLNSWDYYYIPVDTNKVTRPTWLSYTMTGDYVTAIPYAWGGFDTDVTHSTNTSWLDYGDAMSKDRFAGNINTSTGGYQSGTAGVDCSGYVGRAWTLTAYKRNDKQIVDSFGVEIAKTSIGPGDAADWYGHHILILGDWYDPASSGIMTKEANVTPPESGKVDYRTWDYFTANGYKFYKYKNLL